MVMRHGVTVDALSVDANLKQLKLMQSKSLGQSLATNLNQIALSMV
jgi:hypothetical protein